MGAGATTSSLDQFITFAEEFARSHLDTYVATLRVQRVPRQKEFNDPVWGTIVARPHEVMVIDSPLFQRLQRIRQLGVAHLLYRSANHTRFEHSLGALHAMEVLLDALRSAQVGDDATTKAITPTGETTLRLAALLHDVGHPVMSHVGENAVRYTAWARELETEAAEAIEGVEGPKPSELMSYYLIRSSSFRQLIEVMATRSNDISDPSKLVEGISSAILGVSTDTGRPFLAEFLSGPFDVDKLDYIQRDAHFCGLPSVVDVSRLIRKLRTVGTTPEKLPAAVADRLQTSSGSIVVTGVARSGARTLDELALARSLLTDKVYRHQKTRAYEALVSLLISIFVETGVPVPVVLWQITDTDVESKSCRALIDEMGSFRLTKTQRRKLRLAERLRLSYQNRGGFTAAYCWEAPDEASLSDAEATGFAEPGTLREESRRASGRRMLHSEVLKELKRILSVLGLPADPAESQADLQYLFRIDPVDDVSKFRGRALLTRAFLIGDDGSVIRFVDEHPDVEGWTDQYVVNRELSAVFCPEELAPAVHLATERVLFERFGLTTTPAALMAAHVDHSVVLELRTRLDAAGYYGDGAKSLAPTPAELTKPVNVGKMRSAANRLSRFDGPSGDMAAGPYVNPDRILDFLRQLSDAKLVAPMLVALESIRVVGRPDFEAAIGSTLETKGITRENALVAVLGDPFESSPAVTYQGKSVLQDSGITACRIDGIASERRDVLFLVDDFVGQGQRAADVLRSWLGEGDDSMPLPPEAQDRLREMRIVLTFAAGLASSEASLMERLDGLGLDVEVAIHDTTLPTLTDVLANEARGEQLIEELTAIGKGLCLGKGHTPARAAANALGYGGHGLLVTFAFQPPKQAVTALWSSGSYGSGRWRALLPRVD